jgi:hypothetical protein
LLTYLLPPGMSRQLWQGDYSTSESFLRRPEPADFGAAKAQGRVGLYREYCALGVDVIIGAIGGGSAAWHSSLTHTTSAVEGLLKRTMSLVELERRSLVELGRKLQQGASINRAHS